MAVKLFAVGPYCEYTATADSRAALNDCGTFQEFLDALSRGSCPPLTSLNHTAGFTWTPNNTTPDTLYYQVSYIDDLNTFLKMAVALGGGGGEEG